MSESRVWSAGFQMIDRMYVDGLKSLRNVDLDPGSINVLVGPNASGKSSLLQAILLLRQSSAPDGRIDTLRLSGELYEAGMPLDAIHPAAAYTIRVSFESERGPFEGAFVFDRDNERTANNRLLPGIIRGVLPHGITSRSEDFAYLSAERIGPRVAYGLPLGEERLSGRVGKHGEFTSAVLARAFNAEQVMSGWSAAVAAALDKGLSKLDGKSHLDELNQAQGDLVRLSNLLLAWVIPGAAFSVEEHSDTDSASILFLRDLHRTKSKVRATHVGFGL